MSSTVDASAVVTGVGLVTALGYGAGTNEQALLAGRSALATTDAGRAARAAPPFLRATVPEPLEAQVKFLNGAGELAVEAAVETVAHARLEQSPLESSRVGLFLAQRDSYGWTSRDFRPAFVAATRDFSEPLEDAALNRASVRRIRPFFLLENLQNNAFSFLASWFGLRGTNASCGGLGAASGPLLSLAVQAVARHDLDAALVVGAARMSGPVARHELRTLPASVRDTVGPWGDGAGALLIERPETARARNVRPLASLDGFGLTTGRPAERWQLPPAETVAAALRQALSEAAIEPGELRAVVVPFVGEGARRALLARALDNALAGTTVPWLCWRGGTGNMGLASLVAEVGLAAQGVGTGRLPGTVPVEDAAVTPPYASSPLAVDGGAVAVLHIGWLGEIGAVVLRAV